MVTLSFLDVWVKCIGWIITDHQRSCYTVNSVYECVIKEGLCYWGSKTLLREIWNGETSITTTFGRRVSTMDLRGENLSKLNSRSRIDWLQMKKLDKTFLALLLFFSWITGKLNSNLKPRSLVNEAEGEIWSIWSPVRNVKGDVRGYAWNKFTKWRPC